MECNRSQPRAPATGLPRRNLSPHLKARFAQTPGADGPPGKRAAAGAAAGLARLIRFALDEGMEIRKDVRYR